MEKALAIVWVRDDIAAVRHDLPHMPSFGRFLPRLKAAVATRRPPFLPLLPGQGHGPRRNSSVLTGPGLVCVGEILYARSRQTDDAAADALPAMRFLSADWRR